MPNQFGEKLKALREQQNLLQREIAPLLDMDSPLLSKIERGERIAKRETVLKLAKILKTNEDQLLSLWLADRLYKLAQEEDVALKAIQLAEQEIRYQSSKKK
jgi:transcriptional regulator with XRE-family HTH domain